MLLDYTTMTSLIRRFFTMPPRPLLSPMALTQWLVHLTLGFSLAMFRLWFPRIIFLYALFSCRIVRLTFWCTYFACSSIARTFCAIHVKFRLLFENTRYSSLRGLPLRAIHSHESHLIWVIKVDYVVYHH